MESTRLDPVPTSTASRDKPAVRLSDCIEHAFVINLAQRTDRRAEMERELRRVGFVDPSWVEFYAAQSATELAGFPSLGTHGCFLSHLGVLRTALQRGYKSILVMEDDLSVSPEFLVQQAAIAQQLQNEDWAFAYFGHEGVDTSGLPKPLAPYTRDVIHLHFYAVREPYIRGLASYLEQVRERPEGHPLGGPMHVDGAHCMYRAATPSARTLVGVPNMGTQRSSRSDITPRWFDTAFGVRHLVQIARRLRKRL